MQGYKRALAKLGLVADPELMFNVERVEELRDEGGYQATQQLLKVQPRPDGIFCYNDPTAYGAIAAVLEAGLRVPEDVAVVGCGNLLYNKFLQVPLTSVDQQTTAIGREAGALALRLIEAGEPVPPQRILLEPRLVVRKSTARPADRALEAAGT
jgi:LacI family transcriptional regulator